MKINLRYILDLYRKYSDELLWLREEQQKIFSPGFHPRFDDEEAEITYLLLRETKPEIVVEISPGRGWSTSWILRALQANDKGICHSFEMLKENITQAKRNLPDSLLPRWKYTIGLVQTRLEEFPPLIQYLFIDSDHSQSFARWYIENLFPRVRGVVSVHDVFHIGYWGDVSEEGREVLGHLDKIGVDFFSCSLPFMFNHREVQDVRRRMHMGPSIKRRACGCARLLGGLAAVATPETRVADLPRLAVDAIRHILGGDLDALHCNPAMFFSLDGGDLGAIHPPDA